MKKDIFKIGRWAALMSTALILAAPMSFTSCKEDINEDAFAIKTKMTMTDYLTEDPQLSEIKGLFDEVKLGLAENASVLTSVLSARGNYTLFAPTNDAIHEYVSTVTNGTSTSVQDLTLEQKQLIALNCIIDNRSANAYELAEFPSDGATFPLTNLKDRRLSSIQNSETQDYYINGNAKVLTPNIEVSNGMIHTVDHVIAPSTASVAELLQTADNMRIMGKLLDVTGWTDSLKVRTKDEEAYELANLDKAGTVKEGFAHLKFTFQDKRSIGYTIFAEPDSVFVAEWGIDAPVYDEANDSVTNWDVILPQIAKKCSEVLQITADADDYTSCENAVNRFVAYHLLNGSMATDQFVNHLGSYGYNPGSDYNNPVKTGYTVNVWDYFTTKGKYRGLLKITQVADGEPDYFINRHSYYNDGMKGDYKEVNHEPNALTNGLNVMISPINGEFENNAINGFYYPVNHMLVYSATTRYWLSRERMRIDMVTMLPELFSNNVRNTPQIYFPIGYFENIVNENNPNSNVHYLRAVKGGNWSDHQGDEFLFNGRCDFTLRLPPVPETGTYELRMGVSNNDQRSMIQVYLGEDPNHTIPVGLPIDQRELANQIPGNPWHKDTGDAITDAENDRNLRNQGYMKAPNYIVNNDAPKESLRDKEGALRRILIMQEFNKDKTYYIRFKSVIERNTAETFLDYFEFVPKSIVSAEKPEDIW